MFRWLWNQTKVTGNQSSGWGDDGYTLNKWRWEIHPPLPYRFESLQSARVLSFGKLRSLSQHSVHLTFGPILPLTSLSSSVCSSSCFFLSGYFWCTCETLSLALVRSDVTHFRRLDTVSMPSILRWGSSWISGYRRYMVSDSSSLGACCLLYYPVTGHRTAGNLCALTCSRPETDIPLFRIYFHITIRNLFGGGRATRIKLLQHPCFLHLRVCVMVTQACHTYIFKRNQMYTQQRVTLKYLSTFFFSNPTVTSGNLYQILVSNSVLRFIHLCKCYL